MDPPVISPEGQMTLFKDAHDPTTMSKTRRGTGEALTYIRGTLLPYQVCWHIGTLRSDDKGWGSHEGSGLSVSLDPYAWRLIASLGGPLYQMEKGGATFVDAYACLRVKPLMRTIWTWTMQEHYVERNRIYRVDWYDDEQGEWLLLSFLDEQQAKREYRSVREGGPEQVRYSSFIGYVPLSRMTARMHHKTAPLAFVQDFALTLFVEENLTEIDGIWWQDEDNPVCLSAPRGVIFERQVPSWTSILVSSESIEAPCPHQTGNTY